MQEPAHAAGPMVLFKERKQLRVDAVSLLFPEAFGLMSFTVPLRI